MLDGKDFAGDFGEPKKNGVKKFCSSVALNNLKKSKFIENVIQQNSSRSCCCFVRHWGTD